MSTTSNSIGTINYQLESDNTDFKLESLSLDEVKAALEDFCESHLAVGNKRDARVEELTLNGTNVKFRVWIRSKHKPTSWITLYSVTYEIKGEYDLSNPSSLGDTEISVNTPVGKLSVKAKEIAGILMALI